MKKIAFTILFAVASTVAVLAQESYFYANWDISMPMTNTTWVDETSTKGFKFGFRKFFGPNQKYSAGIDLGWTTFSEYKPTTTFPTDNGALTTDYFNYIYNASIAVSGQYYFKVDEDQRFFVYGGLGLGANRNKYTQFYNVYADQERVWGFLVRPEAGILVHFTHAKKIGLMAAVHYDYSSGKSADYNYSGFQAVGFQIGLMSMQW